MAADNQAAELALVGGERHAAKASEECSKELWRRLTESGDAKEAARLIGRVPALLAEVRRIAPRLNARQQPTGAEGVLAQLVPLIPVYGVSDRSESEWAAFWGAYIDALEILPPEALAEAIVAYNRQAKFFPKPGELFMLAQEAATRVRTAAYRAKKAAEWREPGPSPMTVSDEERARRKAEVDALRRGGLGLKSFAELHPPRHADRHAVADRLRRTADDIEETL